MPHLDPISNHLAPPLGELLATVLGTTTEPEFDAISAAAARLSGCELAFVSLVRDDKLWFKAGDIEGFGPLPIESTLCSTVLKSGKPLLLTDATKDPYFSNHPLVCDTPFLRFYAGVPLSVRGRRIGTLCAVDYTPHLADPTLLDELAGLGCVIETLIDARLAATQARTDAAALAQALAGRDRLYRQLNQAERMAEIGSWRLTVADGSLEYSDQVFIIHDLPIGANGALSDALNYYPEPGRSILAEAIVRAVDEGLMYDLELDFITAKGRLRRVRAIAEAEMESGQVVALVGVFQDVTERYEQQKALEREANTDDLTQLSGRRAFNAYLDAIASANPFQRSQFALVLIDLDLFKNVNDRYGHAAGDEVLRRVAAILHSPWLLGSYAARLGGDEFALVISNGALLTDLSAITQRLLDNLVISVGFGDDVVTVSATLGVCHCETGPISRRSLLETADAALYSAKNHLRGTAAFRRLGGAIARVA